MPSAPPPAHLRRISLISFGRAERGRILITLLLSLKGECKSATTKFISDQLGAKEPKALARGLDLLSLRGAFATRKKGNYSYE